MASLLSRPMKAVMDEATAFTHMIDAVIGAQFDAPAAARQTVVQALHAACVQASVRPDDDVTPEDLAQVGMNALRNLVLADQALDVAIYLLATELYGLKIWLALGMDSWDEYVDASLVEGEQADKWKAQLSGSQLQPGELLSAAGIGRDPDKIKHWLKRTVPQVLYPAKEHPVKLEDGTQVDHVWLANHEPSITVELTPLAGKLDMDKPEDVATFQEALTVAATRPRDDFRDFKKEKGYMKSHVEPVRVPAELIEVVDPETGEITHEWRVPEMTFASEADWNFYWMALAKRYNFVVTTRTEKARKHDSAKPKPKSAHRRGTGRGQPVHSLSGRGGKKR